MEHAYPGPSMLLEELKRKTRAQHDHLEARIQIENHLKNLASYRALLERWYGWYAPWEALAAKSSSPRIANFLCSRWKTPLLMEDLRLLNGSTAVPLARIAAPSSEAGWIGAIYVVEGSTLGGQIIARRVKERLRLDRERGCAFFSSYGDELGPKWREFGDFASQVVPATETDAAVAAAKQTFEAIEDWLCPDPKQI